MKLIRNADDYGKDRAVNEAVLTCFARGLIDRTTLMVNLPDAEAAVRAAHEKGFADRVGIHLNLTEGEPLTEPIRRDPLFCDAKGCFHAKFRQSTRHRLYLGREAMREIYLEWEAQLMHYRNFELALFHVDSHHHVHTDLPMYRVLKRLAAEYNFSSIRQSRNLYRGGSVPVRIYKRLYNRSLRNLCEETSDLFGSADDFHRYFSAGAPEIAGDPVIEIMMHPRYDEQQELMDGNAPMENTIQALKCNHLVV